VTEFGAYTILPLLVQFQDVCAPISTLNNVLISKQTTISWSCIVIPSLPNNKDIISFRCDNFSHWIVVVF
jgi:hypothetical protein